MSAEVQLKPGWLMEDVRKASERLTEWAKPPRSHRQHSETTNERDNTISETAPSVPPNSQHKVGS